MFIVQFCLIFHLQCPTESKKPCEFCKLKCSTIVDGVRMCTPCRQFGERALTNRHMFVCKSLDPKAGNIHYIQSIVNSCNYLMTNERKGSCLAKQQQHQHSGSKSSSGSSSNVQPKSKVFCRYCYLHRIVNRLATLRRLQHHLVQFVNKRVFYVNSTSKRTMMWRARLTGANGNDTRTSPPPTTTTIQPSNNNNNSTQRITRSTRTSQSRQQQTHQETTSSAANANSSAAHSTQPSRRKQQMATEGDCSYEVHKVLGEKRVKGRVYLLLNWKGFGHEALVSHLYICIACLFSSLLSIWVFCIYVICC